MITELQKQALSEGIADDTKSVEEKVTTDAKVDSSSTKTDTQQDGAAKPVTETTKLPFHQDPEVQKYIEKMVSKRNGEWEKKFGELKDGYTKTLESITQRSNESKQPEKTLSPEQKQALNELADLMFSNPEIMDKYGLSRKPLEDRVNSIYQERAQETYESEMEQESKKLSDEFGGEAKEWRENLEDFYSNDPWLSEKSYQKGVLGKVAQLYTASKSQELAERKANLKLIREQKEKKTGQAESASSKVASKGTMKEKNPLDFLNRRVSEEGGIQFD